MKRKLLLAALCVVGALGMRAQTDVTGTYITNADFESTAYTTPYNPNGDRDITQPEGWTLAYTGGVSFDSSILKETQATYSNISGQGLTIPGEGRGNQTYAVRFHNNGSSQLITLAQTAQVLPEGHYVLSGSFWTQNQNEIEVGFYKGTYSAANRKKYEAGNKAWRTLTYEFDSDGTSETVLGVFFKHTSGNQMVAGVDNITLKYTATVRPTTIGLNETSLNLKVTGKATLSPIYIPTDANTDTGITWTTSAPTVATVDNGVVTAIGSGNATITATTANNVSTTCDVTVTDVTAVAAPSYYSEVAAGDFYIVNAATGKAIGTIKNGWGTQAGLASHGIPFTVAISDGKYTLDSHTYNSANEHFFNGTFVDGASTNLYINSLGNGKYSISTAEGSAFVTANVNDNIIANTASTSNSVLAQWYFVSKENLVSAMEAATTANPVDATFYIQDPDFSRNHILQLLQNGQTTKNPGNETYQWHYTATNYHFKGGEDGNMCAETYQNNGGKIYQELTGVKNGMYLLKAQAFHNGSGVTSLYANDEKVGVAVLNANGEGTAASMAGASAAFSAGLYNNKLEVFVTDGNLTIGIENASNNWACFDNFELYYLGDIDPIQHKKDIIIAQKGDLTSLVNGTFQDNADGWTGGSHITWVTARGWRGDNATKFYERSSTGALSYTLANMPAGTYKVVAAARGYDGGTITPEIAGTAGTILNCVGDARSDKSGSEINTNGVEMPYSELGGFTTDANGHNWRWITATGVLAADGDLVINFNCEGNAWMCIDDVHLYCTKLADTSYTRTVGDGSGTINANNSVVTADIILDNPNTVLRTTGAITTAAGQNMNNDQYSSSRITKLVLYDGYDYTKLTDAVGADNGAVLYRSIPADTWCTLTVPFWPTTSLTMKYPEALSSEGVLSFATVDRTTWGYVDKPMLIKSASAITAIEGKLASTNNGGGCGVSHSNDMTSGSDVPMQGVYTAGTVPMSDADTYYYYIDATDGMLHKVTGNGVNIAPFRAYFSLSQAVDAPMRSTINLDFDGDATGISLVADKTVEENKVYFNLNGQRVATPTKGIYIVNGKKVYVK